MKPLVAIPTKDRSRIILSKGNWRHTIPAGDLPKWIALYASLRDRLAPKSKSGRPEGPGKYSAVYGPDLKALEAVRKTLAAEDAT